LHLDFETYSACDLKAHGLSRYAHHSTTDIWLGCYAFDDGAVQTWMQGEPCPPDVFGHISSGGEVWAHNAQFEIALCNNVAAEHHGWPKLSAEQCICTMTMAYSMGIPANLEGAAIAMGLKYQKDMPGHRLMLQMSKPKGENEDGSCVWYDDLEKLQRLEAYCKLDIEAERELGKRLLKLSAKERKVWVLDQQINSRGFPVDLKSVERARDIAKAESLRLMEDIQRVTNLQVASCSAVAQITRFLEAQGVTIESLAKDKVAEKLKEELPPIARKVLELRQEGSKTSTKKLDAIFNRVDEDFRIRNAFQYHGSHTGRWAGRGVQLHNLPRGKFKKDSVEQVFELLKEHDAADQIELIYGAPMKVLSDVTRSFFMAPEGKVFLWGDWNAIEARTLGWLAGEEPLLKLFRDGKDVYKYAYARTFNVDVLKVTEDQRQIGKVLVLALGYQGSVGAFQAMAKNYGVFIPDEEVERIVKLWRQAHPAIVRYWYALQEKAIQAVKNPRVVVPVGPSGRQVKFKCSGSFLFCGLPSGRLLTYPYPKVDLKEYEWKGEKLRREQLTYMGEDSLSHKWERQSAYGGLLAENITQAVARDVLAEAMLRLDDAGYRIVAHVHDEVICETMPEVDKAAFQEILETVPEWAPDLPLKAGIEVAKRYRK
jgi:DNA polymerase